MMRPAERSSRYHDPRPCSQRCRPSEPVCRAEGQSCHKRRTHCRPLTELPVLADGGFYIEPEPDALVLHGVGRLAAGQSAEVGLHFLGQDRLPPDPEIAPILVPIVFESNLPKLTSTSWRRMVTALDDGPLVYASCRLPLPKRLSSVWYFGLTVWMTAHGLEVRAEPTSRKVHWHVERLKRDFGWHSAKPTTAYGFFLTRSQMDRRIRDILRWAREHDVFGDPSSDIATDALTKLYQRMLGGFDTPLLAKPWSLEIAPMIRHAVMTAKKQDRRLRWTRYGLANDNRRCVPLRPETASTPGELDARATQEETSRWRRSVRRQIQEVTADPTESAALERILLNGESITVVAKEMSMSYSRTRRLVQRTLRYLGLV